MYHQIIIEKFRLSWLLRCFFQAHFNVDLGVLLCSSSHKGSFSFMWSMLFLLVLHFFIPCHGLGSSVLLWIVMSSFRGGFAAVGVVSVHVALS